MYKANGLFEMEVVSLRSGERMARVKDLVFDEEGRRLVAILVFDGLPFGKGRVVRWEEIESIGDVVVVSTTDPPSLGEDREVEDLHGKGRRLSGTDVLTRDGEKLGTVADLYLDAGGRVVGYEVASGLLRANTFLETGKVASIGPDAVIATDGDLPRARDVEGGSAEEGT